MRKVSDLITETDIQDLWGQGFTIIRRQADPYYVDPKLVPAGMAYQWCLKRPGDGWSPVLASRHDGIYAPAGYKDVIEVGGLMLCERSKSEVDAELKANADKAQQNTDNWASGLAANGLSGGARVGYSDDDSKIFGDVIDDTNHTRIPAELFPYLPEIYKLRDQLLDLSGFAEHTVSEKKAALLAAITTVSERRKDEINGQSTSNVG